MCETLCNWTEIASPLGFPKDRGWNTDSAFVQLCLLSVEYARSLKAEQVVHLRAFKRVTIERAQGTTYLTGGQMFQGADDLLAYVKDEGVEFIDIRFCDLPGTMQHFTGAAVLFGHEFFEDGVKLQLGLSIRGFQKIHESDMALFPDPRRPTSILSGGEDIVCQLLRSRPADQGALQPRSAQHRT